ncbi:HAD family phosphatase [Roseovarius sp. LXJ103]|uniref:HAD family hydrolase n=1 Tax=Roseovarius carneus TaxID=2853164 RepID=UPI000D622846|nr:HAD family phosphatase [Roseovarius carneus]MBZ8119914.1 HAD family phosphatase [Roseovarius carneus]PWE34494.1 HAD family phosphatase [Pelagicola sp. LXJ1103]
MTVDTVIFDIGGVLVDWQPHLAWVDELGIEGTRAFMDRVGFDKINFACDGGATFAQAASLIKDPEDSTRVAQYVTQHTSTVSNKLSETWDILYALKNKGVALHAITNWSAETWPKGLKIHPELGTVFGTTVVSGQLGILKPSTEIYKTLCERAQVRPDQCVFVDDGLHNCLGARAVGMDAIHFTGARDLRGNLEKRGLL